MASPRTRNRKQQRLAFKQRLALKAKRQQWWNGLTNQEKHDADYHRYRIEVLGHSASTVLDDIIQEVTGRTWGDLMAPSPLYRLLK